MQDGSGERDWAAWARAWWAESPAGAHDRAHAERVLATMQRLAAASGWAAQAAPPHVLAVAAYGHDLVQVPKNHPQRQQASRMAARAVAGRLAWAGYPPRWLGEVAAAIRDHSFSAGRVPTTLLGQLLQDADRLEALGAIGWARLFATAGAMGSHLWHANDPAGTGRTLDDRRWALDHVLVKLERLPATMCTAAGRALAQTRWQRVAHYRADLLAEVAGDA